MNSLTLENLYAIKNAMEKIEHIDRSQFFNDYYKEVVERITDLKMLREIYLKSEECFQNFLNETDLYLERLKLRKDTEQDSGLILRIPICIGATDYQRVLSRASTHSPMHEEYPLERVLKYSELLHKHRDFALAGKEMYKK